MKIREEIEAIFSAQCRVYFTDKLRNLIGGETTERLTHQFWEPIEAREKANGGAREPWENAYLQYGEYVFQPLMNKALGLPENHDTWYPFLHDCLKDVLDKSPIIREMRGGPEWKHTMVR